MEEYTNQNQEPDSSQVPQNQPQENPPQENPPQNLQEPPKSQPNQGRAPQGQPPFQQHLYQNQQPYPPQYHPYPPQYQPYPPKQSNGLALASMIVSIFALITCCIPFLQFPLAVTAIVLVILSKKGRPLHGFAIAGLVMGIISILMSIFMTFYWGIVISTMNDPEFMSMYNEILEMYQ